MPYQLVLSDMTHEQAKDVGENVFLNNLPMDYKVFLFYYPGAMLNQELETSLRSLGDMTGKNLFVNIGRLNDPNYVKIANNFEIKNLPVIVMTAVADLASPPPPSSYFSAYVRIDNKKLLDSPEKTLDCLQKLFNLFISGQVAAALKEAKNEDRKILVAAFAKVATGALQELWKFIGDLNISFSVVEGKFELKHG